MVKAPVDAAFATADPFSMPMKPVAMTATFAGPPGLRPASAMAPSLMSCERPVAPRIAPKRMKRNM